MFSFSDDSSPHCSLSNTILPFKWNAQVKADKGWKEPEKSKIPASAAVAAVTLRPDVIAVNQDLLKSSTAMVLTRRTACYTNGLLPPFCVSEKHPISYLIFFTVADSVINARPAKILFTNNLGATITKSRKKKRVQYTAGRCLTYLLKKTKNKTSIMHFSTSTELNGPTVDIWYVFIYLLFTSTGSRAGKVNLLVKCPIFSSCGSCLHSLD